MKDDLLNKGYQATENKQVSISDFKTAVIIMLIITCAILACVSSSQIADKRALLSQQDSLKDIVASKQADIKSLTHANNMLINK